MIAQFKTKNKHLVDALTRDEDYLYAGLTEMTISEKGLTVYGLYWLKVNESKNRVLREFHRLISLSEAQALYDSVGVQSTKWMDQTLEAMAGALIVVMIQDQIAGISDPSEWTQI